MRRNIDLNSSIERMKYLMEHGKEDYLNIKPNINETVEYKIEGPDGNTYGIVRERQKYFIKESKNGAFEYIGGAANKSENEYTSYNLALKNLELKVRSMNESLNINKSFEALDATKKDVYIVEATEDMRKEIARQKEIMNGVSKILDESKTEFISKPVYKDPEGFGTAGDPKKQGEPFDEPAKAKLDKDMPKSNVTPKTAAKLKDAKLLKDGVDMEDAKFVPDNSVANKKPKGGKVFRVTEAQFKEAKRLLGEGYFDDDVDLDDGYVDDEFSDVVLRGNRRPVGSKSYPVEVDMDSEDDFTDDDFGFEDDEDAESIGNEEFPIPSKVKYLGVEQPKLRAYSSFDYVGAAPGIGKSYIMSIDPRSGKEEEFIVKTEDLERVPMTESNDYDDDDFTYNKKDFKRSPRKFKNIYEEADEEELIDEGLWDTVKGVANVGKYFGKKAGDNVANTANKVATNVKQGVQTAANKVADTTSRVAGNIKQGVQNVANTTSQVYNQSQAQSSQASIEKIADNLKNELINLNNRTIKSGGQPLNYNSVVMALSNKLRGKLKSGVKTESVDEFDDDLINEITEQVLNVFGQHPGYRKAPFTTPETGQPFGQKIGNSAPFKNAVKEPDAKIKGEVQDKTKTPTGKKGSDEPFVKKPVEKSPKMKGEVEDETPLPTKKRGSDEPFTKSTNKQKMLNKLAESIVKDLKKKD